MNHLENTKLLAAWKKIQLGDKELFEQIFNQFFDDLFNYGHKITSDTAVIEDSIQELFIYLWYKKSTLDIRHSFKNYLYRSFRLRLIENINKASFQELSEEHFQAPIRRIDPTLSNNNQKNWVRQNLTKLSKREKEVLYLKYYDNLDYNEISQITGLTVNGLYKLTSRGIQKLKTLWSRSIQKDA